MRSGFGFGLAVCHYAGGVEDLEHFEGEDADPGDEVGDRSGEDFCAGGDGPARIAVGVVF